MAKKRLEQCKSGKDFIRYAEKSGARIDGCNGSHHKVKTDKGMVIVAYHNKDLGTGIRSKIIKAFIAIGITGFILYVQFVLGGF